MSLKPIKEFLIYIDECHNALADLYFRLSLEAQNEKVKLLLDFMRNKERLSSLHLREYIQHAPLSLLNTWLDNMCDQSFPMKCQLMRIQPKLSLEDVIALAMKFYMQLVELVQTAAYNSPTIEAELALADLSIKEEETFYQVINTSNEFEFI